MPAGIISDVTIWGGTSGNIFEDMVSTLVQAQREHLHHFIFLPEKAQGWMHGPASVLQR